MDEAKKLLNDTKYINFEIEDRINSLEKLKSMMLRTAGMKEISVQESVDNKTEEMLVKFVELSEQLKIKIDEYVDSVIKINRYIDKLDNPLQRTVIRSRYINNLSWKVIANKLGYVESSVLRIHKEALEELQKIYSE